ncbi:DNA-binding protein [Clostridium lacusfryxellense]|uniref:DNA-binding protein n=1 Tax=Clostridium lacusfryxellense TaxID=205328 RepID=UPI001C0C7F2A|nr:DNA-binding protein [Clostridium lacusfryxellense]MBU3112541.1 DNA-binding protein [Clostridium lacusfryxellense]
MTKEEFNNLNVLEQLGYINDLLEEGKSLRNISSSLGMSKTTFRERFTKIGYLYDANTGQYAKSNTLDIQIHQDNTKVPQKSIMSNKGYIREIELKELQKYKYDLIELVNHKDDILEMLENYKNSSNVIASQFDIDNLPKDLQKDIINKSVKVYKPVYKLFNELCKSYSGYKKQDLVSVALLEFYNKYKK